MFSVQYSVFQQIGLMHKLYLSFLRGVIKICPCCCQV